MERVYLIVVRIAYFYLGRAPNIARVRATSDRLEYVAVENLHVGHANQVTLLTTSIDEVGRGTRFAEIAILIVVIDHFWLLASHVFCHGDVAVAIHVAV